MKSTRYIYKSPFSSDYDPEESVYHVAWTYHDDGGPKEPVIWPGKRGDCLSDVGKDGQVYVGMTKTRDQSDRLAAWSVTGDAPLAWSEELLCPYTSFWGIEYVWGIDLPDDYSKNW